MAAAAVVLSRTLKEATGLEGRALFEKAAEIIGTMPKKPKAQRQGPTATTAVQ